MRETWQSLLDDPQTRPFDGVLALLLIVGFYIAVAIELSVIPQNAQYQYIQLAVQSKWYLMIAILLVLRRQSISTIGLGHDGIAWIATGIATLAAAAIAWKATDIRVLVQWVFLLVAVSGVEAFVFRGFALPRLAKLMKHPVPVVLVLGVLFGCIHNIRDMIWDGAPWYAAVNYIVMGLLMTLLFSTAWFLTGSIVNAILLHTAINFSEISPVILYGVIVYLVILVAFRFFQERRTQPQKAAP